MTLKEFNEKILSVVQLIQVNNFQWEINQFTVERVGTTHSYDFLLKQMHILPALSTSSTCV